MTDTLAIPPRPYAKVKGSEPSVTTILDVKKVPGLDWGAAKETALCAVYEDGWKVDSDGALLSPPEQADNLRRHFRGLWDGRAYMGTLIHKMLEGWIENTTVDIHALVDAHKPWAKIHDDKVTEAMGYVNGLAEWWEEAEPTDIRTEEVVRTPGLFIGTKDITATINWTDGSRRRALLDAKTTAEQRPDKAIYGDSWALQLAPYRYAREIVKYGWVPGTDSRGKPKNVLAVTGVEDNEEVEVTGIVHLRGDNTYTLYEVDTGPDVYDVFLSMIPIAAWLKSCAAPIPVDLGGHR